MKKTLFVPLALILALSASVPAYAAELQKTEATSTQSTNNFNKKLEYGRFYFGLSGGMVLPQKTDITLFSTFYSDGKPTSRVDSFKGKIKYKPSETVNFFAGYQINPYFGTQAEIGYENIAIESIKWANGSEYKPGKTEKLDNFLGFLQLIVYPTGDFIGVGEGLASVRFKPYAGAGAGVLSQGRIHGQHTQIDITLPFKQKREESLAADALAGAQVYFLDDIVSLGVEYRYTWANTASKKGQSDLIPTSQTGYAWKETTKTGDAQYHTVLGQVAVHF